MITREEMHRYGYTFDGMTPCTAEEARAQYKGACVYAFYSDDTEALIECEQDIAEHADRGGMFGIDG